MATESSVVPSVFTTDDRMTLVSSWTTLCRGGFGSRRGTKKDATFSRGTQAPLSFEFGLPEGQTPRDECRRPPFWGQKQHVFPCYYIELSVSRARRRLKCRKLVLGPPSPAGEGPDSGRKVLTKRLVPKSELNFDLPLTFDLFYNKPAPGAAWLNHRAQKREGG